MGGLKDGATGLIIDIGIPLRVAKDSVATAMNEALEDDVEFYPNRDDGHPFERGYRAYANVATDLWNEMRFR